LPEPPAPPDPAELPEPEDVEDLDLADARREATNAARWPGLDGGPKPEAFRTWAKWQ